MSSIYNHSRMKEERENAESTAYSRTSEPKTRNGIIVNSTVSLRTEPNHAAKSIGLLAPGTKVKIIGRLAGFYKVELDLDRTGFVSSSFCEEV